MYYFWTDGSSSLKTGMCGWAAIGYIQMNDISLKIGKECSRREIIYGFDKGTNQKAELLAILHALRRTCPGSKVHIKTDSEYSINCVLKFRDNWAYNNFITSSGTPVKNLEIIKELWKLCDDRKVTFQHVRGHQGLAGNEAADFVAGLARRMGEGQFDKECVEVLIKEKLTYDELIFKD